ncbi:hypothetical protein C1I98_13460 [Spongiactinospora gelatinilytica]|uniref:Uncharacterized protein n=1 Tax=Spongiactinospora gelatinilytica TaxID=2666298 RepID=A0A2W2GHY6_9ACTN|nr:hypothetical protein [Spongiactinospora gelatinilytica]PZG47472.1 hypothetical protein C1I98_13460 [Spongiactinospora gelatinilytica]
MTIGPEWIRLGDLLKGRRIELGRTVNSDWKYRRRFVRAHRYLLVERVAHDLEEGKRDNYDPATLRRAEVAYQLPQGAIARILADGDPGAQTATDAYAGMIGDDLAAFEVYIAEVVWFDDNPVDGRDRIAVCACLDAALKALRDHDVHGGDLVATETTSALGTDSARTWAVHERGEEPDDDGHLWITREQVTG